jgi:hypothetical protein
MPCAKPVADAGDRCHGAVHDGGLALVWTGERFSTPQPGRGVRRRIVTVAAAAARRPFGDFRRSS